MSCEVVGGIHLAQYSVKWQAVMVTLMKFRV